MKLKYLKSIHPKAEETLILDVLASKDNNVQKASEELVSMGFNKKEKPKPKPKDREPLPLPPKKLLVVTKTTEEKNALKNKIQKQFPGLAEKVLSIALESANYNEDRVEQILSAVLKEEQPTLHKVELKETKRPSVGCDTLTI